MSLFASGRITENRYYDWNDCVHHIFGQTGGAQGDPLEMIAFCMTTLHIWGRIMGQHLEERAVAYTDDGYFVGRLSFALAILFNLPLSVLVHYRPPLLNTFCGWRRHLPEVKKSRFVLQNNYFRSFSPSLSEKKPVRVAKQLLKVCECLNRKYQLRTGINSTRCRLNDASGTKSDPSLLWLVGASSEGGGESVWEKWLSGAIVWRACWRD